MKEDNLPYAICSRDEHLGLFIPTYETRITDVHRLGIPFTV